MVLHIDRRLPPVPAVVLDNARRLLPAIHGRRAALAPHGEMAASLAYRGWFADIDIIGALSDDPGQIGSSVFNLDILSYDQIEAFGIEALICVNPLDPEAGRRAAEIAARRGIALIDLCAGYDHRRYRRELADLLNYRAILRQRGVVGTIPRAVATTIPNEWGLGDILCALSAARRFARAHPEHEVYFNLLPSIVEAYGDNLVRPGRNALVLPDNCELFHRAKISSPAANYLGCYLLGLGLDFDENPGLELPPVPPLPGLEPGGYAVLQPRAFWAKPNLSAAQVQALADGLSMPVVQVGRQDPEYPLRGVNQLGMGDPMTFLRAIRHAAVVLTPRSAGAHIAAGYRVPTVVWLPHDGENWHLDYPSWPHRLLPVDAPEVVQTILGHVSELLAPGTLG